MSDLPKTFDPAAIESRWYAHWEGNGLFHPERPGAEPWTIVNPPPNVTGSLHIGHALDNTLQDVLVRHARLKGKDALWVVGTDHAGIATQMVVERQMAERQDKRTNYTREAFVEKVWDWKRESGGSITRQLRRLGCSMDWANERFTMDAGFEKAVLKVFVDLYNTVKPDGTRLLYRDKRLVNWDPGLGTAISDLEVETQEVRGQFWHFRYPLADDVMLPDGRDHLVVATTRPETMLADMAVAVNPADERYASVVGQYVIQPITGRRLEIIADDHADPALGSGVVKITPGHDFNDFEVGARAGIKAADMLNMFDARANVVQTGDGRVPPAFVGLHRFRKDGVDGARELAVGWMKEHGFLLRHTDKDGTEHDAEPRTIQTPFGDRSGVVIEPWLTDQWYVDAATLAKPAVDAVRDGRIRIVPKTWEKTFFNWMENIQPWCVSRQLWWGHRIPAWYGLGATDEEDRLVFVAYDEEAALGQAYLYHSPHQPEGIGSSYHVVADEAAARRLRDEPGNRFGVWRDPDVLDTWFSSALWPFATMGWPDADPPRDGEVAARSVDGGGSGGAHTATPPPPRPAGAVPLPVPGRSLGDLTPPFVPSDVEGQAESDARGVSTSLDTNGWAKRYPNDVLISGFDILFFWDARMMMQGLHFMGDVPFRTLYLHGLVRAADGQKMSKSKGNTVDPIGLIDRYGADALRFFMAAMESQGRDIKMDERRVEGYRNFATKLWNAARFAQANGIGASSTLEPPPATLAVNHWIIAETIGCVQAMDLALADLRFDAAANAIYQFVWSRFCDWYLELIKPVASGDERGAIDAETRAVAGWVLDQILVLLHPFMPFITEELWHALADPARPRDNELIVARWPMADARALDPEASREIDWLIRLVSEVRGARSEVNVPPGARLTAYVRDASDATRARLTRQASSIARLARFEVGEGEPTSGGLQVVVDEATFLLPLEGVIDLAAERARLAKASAAAAKERDALAARLGNASFVDRAKPEAVEKARTDHADKAAEAERLSAALARLG